MELRFHSIGCLTDEDCGRKDPEGFNFQECRELETGLYPNAENSSLNGCICNLFFTEMDELGRCIRVGSFSKFVVFMYVMICLTIAISFMITVRTVLGLKNWRITYETIFALVFQSFNLVASFAYFFCYIIEVLMTKSIFQGFDESGYMISSLLGVYNATDLISVLALILLMLQISQVWLKTAATLDSSKEKYKKAKIGIYFIQILYTILSIGLYIPGSETELALRYLQITAFFLLSALFGYGGYRIIRSLEHVIEQRKEEHISNKSVENSLKVIRLCVIIISISTFLMGIMYIVDYSVYIDPGNTIAASPGMHGYFWIDLSINFVWTVILVTSTWFLFRMVIPKDRSSAYEKQGVNVEKLNFILITPSLSTLFLKFSTEEHSDESFRFLLDVRDFENSYNSMDIIPSNRRFKQIIAEYIQTGAKSWININSRIRKELLDLAEKQKSENEFLRANVFAKAATEIHQMLALDAVSRFYVKYSKEITEALEAAALKRKSKELGYASIIPARFHKSKTSKTGSEMQEDLPRPSVDIESQVE